MGSCFTEKFPNCNRGSSAEFSGPPRERGIASSWSVGHYTVVTVFCMIFSVFPQKTFGIIKMIATDLTWQTDGIFIVASKPIHWKRGRMTSWPLQTTKGPPIICRVWWHKCGIKPYENPTNTSFFARPMIEFHDMSKVDHILPIQKASPWHQPKQNALFLTWFHPFKSCIHFFASSFIPPQWVILGW